MRVSCSESSSGAPWVLDLNSIRAEVVFWVLHSALLMLSTTEDAVEPDPEPGPEADMDEPDDAEPTAAEYDEFFNSIPAMP